MVLVGLLAGCSTPPAPLSTADGDGQDRPAGVQRLAVEVLARYPHDAGAFTQGLELHDGVLYEGTGRYGRSEMRVVELRTGEVSKRVPLPATAFGEGITVLDGRIWQLTWQEEIAFRRDPATLAEVDQARYTGAGWGLCHQPEHDRLVMSNGSAELTFRDPDTFAPVGAATTVTRGGQPLQNINELECVDGKVWANVWQTDEIVRIDPDTGAVEAVVDATGLLPESERLGADVLNGIAAVPETDTFLITGKLWPTMFLVRFVPA